MITNTIDRRLGPVTSSFRLARVGFWGEKYKYNVYIYSR